MRPLMMVVVTLAGLMGLAWLISDRAPFAVVTAGPNAQAIHPAQPVAPGRQDTRTGHPVRAATDPATLLPRPANQTGAVDTDHPQPRHLQPQPRILSDMHAELAQVAQAYEQASRYPPFSQPVFSRDELARFMPETPASVSLPFPREDGRAPVRIRLDLDKYQYFPGETIRWHLSVVDPEGQGDWQAQLSIRTLSGQTLVAGRVETTAEGHLNLPQPLPGVWEYQLQAQIQIDGAPYRIAAPFRLNPPVARVTGLSWAAPEGDWLVLGLGVDVFRPGYYFLSANLYSAETGEPVMHLEGEQRLPAGSTTVRLQAHGSALRARGVAGPYLLRDIRLIRGAEEGEDSDLSGQPPSQPLPVPGFALDTWEDTPWADPLSAERTEFLKKLAGLTQEPSSMD